MGRRAARLRRARHSPSSRSSLLIPTWPRMRGLRAGTFLAGAGGLPGGREAGAGSTRTSRRERRHDDRPVDGQHPPVLRPSAGLRPLGQPEPAQPQPVLRGRSINPDRRSATTSCSTSSGTPSRRAALHVLLAAGCCATRRATTAGWCTREVLPAHARSGQTRPTAGDRRLRGAAVIARPSSPSSLALAGAAPAAAAGPPDARRSSTSSC